MFSVPGLHDRARPSADPVRPDRDAAVSPSWFAACPVGTVVVDAARPRSLAIIAPGTPVAITSSRPFSRSSVRRICRAHGVRIDRELVALPSLSRPLVLLDDDRHTVSGFWGGVAAIPPAPGWATAAATLVLTLAERAPWQWTGAMAPGRIVLGERR